MQIGVAYVDPESPVWLRLDVPEGSCVGDAIHLSGVLKRFPQIDLKSQKVGIFGKVTTLDADLKEGDRIEIYRAITCDPATVRRRGQEEEE